MKIVSLLSWKLYGPQLKRRGSSAGRSLRREKELTQSAPMWRSTLQAMDTVGMALPFLQGLMDKSPDHQFPMKQTKHRGKS